jgi:hypothetical protein
MTGTKPGALAPDLALYQQSSPPAATAGVYCIPIVEVTPIDAAGAAKALIDPFFRGAAQMVTTAASIDIKMVIGPAMAGAIRALGPATPPGIQSFNAFVAAQRITSALYTPDLYETRESFSSQTSLWIAATAQALIAVNERAPNAFCAFKDLGDWLGAADEEIAIAIGIGRTTVYSWRREGREPRRGTAQRIYEYHSVLASLRRRLGAQGFALWLSTGNPARRELLLAGKLESLGAAVDAALFTDAGHSLDLAWSGEDRGSVEPGAAAEPLRPSGRRARRARLR